MDAIDELKAALGAEQGGAEHMPAGALDDIDRDPEAYLSFFAFRDTVMEPGDLSRAMKLTIALAALVARGGDATPALIYVGAAFNAGATAQQIREALRVSMLIGGSPAFPIVGAVGRRLVELEAQSRT